MASISLRSIHKSFGASDVLKGVSLDVQDGEFISLVGPSGCGKSTLLRIIAGLSQPDSGEVEINGESVLQKRPGARDLAMVFQSYALYPHLSVFENLAAPLRLRKMSVMQRQLGLWRITPTGRATNKLIHDQIRSVCDLLDIGAFLTRKPAELSGGQQQRVALGRAIVRNPRAFLLDEPLSNLDATIRESVRAELSEIHRSLSATFICVTHDQQEAMTMSDRVAVMMDGHLLQVGTPSQIFADPTDLRVARFIGSPRINLFPATVTQHKEVHLARKPVYVGQYDELTPDQSVIVGVRAHDLRLTGSSEEQSVTGNVRLIENIGADLLVHVETESAPEPIIVREKASALGRLKIGGEVRVFLSTGNILVFQADGQRVRPVTSDTAEYVA